MQVGTDQNEKIKAIAIGVYDAINKKDSDLLRNLFAQNIIRHATAEIGVEAAINMMEKMFETSPDTHFNIEDVIVDRNKAALRVTIHRRGLPANKPLPNILEIFRIENDQVVEIWGAGISPEKFPQKT